MPQSNTPPSEEQTPNTETLNPRDALNLKKAKIQLLEAELSEADAALDAEFIDGIEKHLTPEELDLRLDDDIRPFLTVVEEKREAFYREKLDALKGNIETIRSEVADEEETLDIEDAKRSFLEAHPEADWKAVVDFFHNDMSPRQKEELAGLGLMELMEKVYAIYSKKNKKPSEPTPEPAANIPPDLNNAPSQAVAGDPSPVAKDDAYLARIGVRR